MESARVVYDGDDPGRESICTVEWMTGRGSSTQALALVQEYVDRGERVPRLIVVGLDGTAVPHYD